MRTLLVSLVMLALCSFVVVAGWSQAQQAPASEPAAPVEKPAAAVAAPQPQCIAGPIAVETLKPITALCLHMTGSYAQHPAAITQLMTMAGMRGVVRGGPFGVYYNSPGQVPEDSLSWDVCVPVPAGTTAEAPFVINEMPEVTAAVVICTGPYEDTGRCFAILSDWIAANGYVLAGPPQEHWLSDASAPPAEMQVRLVFPVAKKQ